MSKEAMKLEKIMEQAQVFASAWSLVGGRFDSGNMLDEAEAAKNELRQMVTEALAEPDFWEGYVPEPDKRQQALDKKAENARELGLDYEPVCNKDPQGCWNVRCQLGKKCKNTSAQPTVPQDIPDLIAGALGVSRGTAYDMMREALAEQPAPVAKLHEQEPVAKVCHDLDGHIGWNPNLRQLPDEGTALYTSPPTLSLAQRPHECSRSHPHENMNAMCELRTEIARLTNENARLKALHQGDEINTYRMTLLCIRDGLQQGMSKSIQKLQAREINDVLGLPSFASYRTSPPAQRTWVELTEDEAFACKGRDYFETYKAIEAKLKEKNT